MVVAEPEVMSTPDVDVHMNIIFRGDYCPFKNGQCLGEVCKFWFGNDCIIAQHLKKEYTRDF